MSEPALNKANDELDRSIIRGEAGVPSKILVDFMTEHEKGFYSSNPTPAKAVKIRKKYIAQIEAYVNHRLTQFAEEISSKSKPVLYVASVERKTVYSEKPDNAVPVEAVTATLKEFVKGAKDEE